LQPAFARKFGAARRADSAMDCYSAHISQ
jgi:hypothetical protein